jgi:hypothetical protein
MQDLHPAEYLHPTGASKDRNTEFLAKGWILESREKEIPGPLTEAGYL